MILNDREISRLAKEADMIAPFAEGGKRPGVISYGVTSYGYDMRVADEWVQYLDLSVNPIVDPKAFANVAPYPTSIDGTHPYGWYSHVLPIVEIRPGAFILCRSVEYFRMPEDVIGVVVGKSTYARCGLIVNCTPMEPGWHGHLTIELHNASQHAIKVYANEGIAQVMFHRGDRPAVTYADKGGKYQGQTGVTLGKVE